jgi:uncharacterized protein YggT (Ycf19 family)
MQLHSDMLEHLQYVVHLLVWVLNNEIFWLIYTKAICSCVKQEYTEEIQEGLRSQYI